MLRQESKTEGMSFSWMRFKAESPRRSQRAALACEDLEGRISLATIGNPVGTPVPITTTPTPTTPVTVTPTPTGTTVTPTPTPTGTTTTPTPTPTGTSGSCGGSGHTHPGTGSNGSGSTTTTTPAVHPTADPSTPTRPPGHRPHH